MRNYTLVFLCIFVSRLLAQSPTSVLSTDINVSFLEYLVKVGVDDVRTEHGLKPLANDSILYVAANFHANYLKDIKSLSHKEKGDSTVTPQMRAQYFGAENYLVGENILYIPFGGTVQPKKGKPFDVITYQDAANAMVNGWVNSPGHYKNIITSNYEVTGLALMVDYEKKRIYAVQKFAEVLFRYKFTENKQFFKYSNYSPEEEIVSHQQVTWDDYEAKYPYKIKPLKKDEAYLNALNLLRKGVGFQRLKVKNNSVYLEMDLNAEALVRFLEKRGDGFAIEYINYMPYDCGNEEYYKRASRRNGMSQLSDTLLIPVYKNDLMKGFRPKRKPVATRIKAQFKDKENDKNFVQKVIDGYNMPYYPDKFRYRVARLPREVQGGYYEMNLVYIKNQQIYYVQHFTGICGEYYQEFNFLEYQPDFGDDIYKPVARSRELSFDFKFQKGKSDYSYNDLKPVLDSLTNDKFIVLSAQIDAYSSVEGSQALNSVIQQKRAESIISAFESKQSAKIKPQITTHTNWPLFKQQIDSNEALKGLRGLDSTDIILRLKDPRFVGEIEPFLSKQRVAKVQIKTVFDLNDSTLPGFIKAEYAFFQLRTAQNKALYDSKEMLKVENSEARRELKQKIIRDLDTLKSIQLYVFNQIKAGVFDKRFISEMEYEGGDWTEALFINHFYMEDYFGLADNERKFEVEALQSYATEDKFYSIGAYNYLRFLIKKWDGKSKLQGYKTEEVQNYLGFIGSRKKELLPFVQKLKINFWFKAAQYHFLKKETNKKNEYLVRIFLYYRDKKISELHALKLAKFFVHFEYYTPAIAILDKFHDSTKDEEVLAYLYKLKNYNNIERGNDDFAEQVMKIRERMSQQNWCNMFVGECNISFQVFDHEQLRNMYCEECAQYQNKIEKVLTDKNK